MTKEILAPKPCRNCGKLMLPSDYTNASRFHNTKHCSTRCGASQSGADRWARLMAYRVKDGHSKTLEEIAEIAGVTRERVRQIQDSALRKLANSPSARRELKGFIE